jgi:hypothetical protein
VVLGGGLLGWIDGFLRHPVINAFTTREDARPPGFRWRFTLPTLKRHLEWSLLASKTEQRFKLVKRLTVITEEIHRL